MIFSVILLLLFFPKEEQNDESLCWMVLALGTSL